MSFRLVSPANIADVADCISVLTPRQATVMRWQIDEGASWAVRDEADQAVAIAGLMPWQGEWQLWFLPGKVDAAGLLFALRAARLTLASGAYHPVTVETETEAGRRLARLLGFKLVADDGKRETWQWR